MCSTNFHPQYYLLSQFSYIVAYLSRALRHYLARLSTKVLAPTKMGSSKAFHSGDDERKPSPPRGTILPNTALSNIQDVQSRLTTDTSLDSFIHDWDSNGGLVRPPRHRRRYTKQRRSEVTEVRKVGACPECRHKKVRVRLMISYCSCA
jgi:hypothetical protein